MDETSFVLKLRDFTFSQAKRIPFPPAAESVVQEAEKELGFSIPRLLRLCYLAVGNGRFGPGYGVIALKGGYASDHGTLVSAYETLQDTLLEAQQALKTLTTGVETGRLLPFCEFGCNIFACVDADDVQQTVYSLEQRDLWREKYDLRRFFEIWMAGLDYSSQQDGIEVVEREIINPFTGKEFTVRARTRRR